MYQLYTDGSCKGNGNGGSIGGYSFVVINENNEAEMKFATGAIKNTTNNRMELSAIIDGLEYMNKNHKDFHCEVFTDSAYIFNCYKQKWYVSWKKNGWKNSKKEPVKNRELWEKLIPYFEDKRFIFNKVKGHAGHKWNEQVDTMAQSAAEG